MRQGWALGFTLSVAFFALTIGLGGDSLANRTGILHGSPRTHRSLSTTGLRTDSGTSAVSVSGIPLHRISITRLQQPYVS